MTDELYDRITEILDEASTESGALAVPDDDGDGADDDLLELSEEAADLLESTDPRELLEAVGLGTLEDGTEPETVPEAITKGEPERVEELRRLVRLAKLGDREAEGELETVIDGLREATEDGDDEDADEADDRSDTEDESADEDDEETTDESKDGDEEETTDDEEAADDGSATDELEERLRDAVGSSVEEFGADLESVRDQLAAAGADDESDEDEEDGLLDSAGELLDSDESDEDDDDDDGLLDDDEDEEDDDDDDGLLDDDEDEEDDDDDDDDGLLGSDDDGLGSSESSRYSTMAPPPNRRADMNAVKRHSTMPKRNR